jgi:hypothetical protein
MSPVSATTVVTRLRESRRDMHYRIHEGLGLGAWGVIALAGPRSQVP